MAKWVSRMVALKDRPIEAGRQINETAENAMENSAVDWRLHDEPVHDHFIRLASNLVSCAYGWNIHPWGLQ
jgi:hypothetical protein